MSGKRDIPLPEMLAHVAELTDSATAVALARNFGGVGLYFPLTDNLDAQHRLAKVIGLRAAQVLCDYYGGTEVAIPLGPARPLTMKQKILAAAEDKSLSHTDIALKLGTTDRWVREVLSPSDDNGTASLFD